MSNELSMVNLKINEIITILMLQFESPENYRDLAEYLARFKLQNSQNPLESMRSMIDIFESNRSSEEENSLGMQ